MWAKVREGSPGARSGTTGVRFVKQVGFIQAVKERKLWMNRVVKQKRLAIIRGQR